MKTSTLIASVLSMCLVGIAAGADTLRVDFALVNNPKGDPYSPGAIVEYEIIGTLATDTDSQGLAFFAYDIQIDGLTKITLETAATNSSTDDSASFEKNLGYSDEFGGTVDENDLIQAGGGQNTIGNTENDVPPFPVGDVVLDVGFPPDGAVLMTGVLILPGPGEIEDGTYTMSIIDGSLYANVISLDGGPLGGQPVFPVETADVLIGDALVFDVVSCIDAIAPQLVHPGEPPTGISWTDHAFSGYIDPRRESTDGDNVNQGIGGPVGPGVIPITMVFDEPVYDLGSTNGGTQPGVLTTAGFTVAVTGGVAPVVTAVTTDDNMTVTIELNLIIPLQEWTTIIAVVEDECGNAIEVAKCTDGNCGPLIDEPDRIDIGFLPADISQDGNVNSLDLLRFRQCSNNNNCWGVENRGGVPEDYNDIDRNGIITTLDLLRFRQLMAGTGTATKPWLFETMRNTQP